MARKRKTPLVIRPLGTLAPWSLRQGNGKNGLHDPFERANLEGASAIHCTSPEELTGVRTLGIKTPAFWLPLGVAALPPLPDARTLLRKQFGLPPDARVILFLSRLHPKKRPEILIESLPFLLLQKQNSGSLVDSRGRRRLLLRRILARARERHGLETRVFFPGIVTGPGKNLLLRGADCFALASQTENFSIATAEALAAPYGYDRYSPWELFQAVALWRTDAFPSSHSKDETSRTHKGFDYRKLGREIALRFEILKQTWPPCLAWGRLPTARSFGPAVREDEFP